MHKQESEKEFEDHVREQELLLRKDCRIHAYTDADRDDFISNSQCTTWSLYFFGFY